MNSDTVYDSTLGMAKTRVTSFHSKYFLHLPSLSHSCCHSHEYPLVVVKVIDSNKNQ